MAAEPDAHEVVHLALHEVRAFPDAGHRRDRGIILGHAGLEPDPRAVGKGQQMVDDLKALRVLGIVGRADVGDVIERGCRVIVQERRDLHDATGDDTR